TSGCQRAVLGAYWNTEGGHGSTRDATPNHMVDPSRRWADPLLSRGARRRAAVARRRRPGQAAPAPARRADARRGPRRPPTARWRATADGALAVRGGTSPAGLLPPASRPLSEPRGFASSDLHRRSNS